MDTLEARTQMLELAQRALDLIERYTGESESIFDARRTSRAMLVETRSLLSDAGHPGQGVWEALRHLEMGLTSYDEPASSHFWPELSEELTLAAHTLDALLSSPGSRESDFRIVG